MQTSQIRGWVPPTQSVGGITVELKVLSVPHHVVSGACPGLWRGQHQQWLLFMTQVLQFLQCNIFWLAPLPAPRVAFTRPLGFYLTHSHPSIPPQLILHSWSQGLLEPIAAILVVKAEFTLDESPVQKRDKQPSTILCTTFEAFQRVVFDSGGTHVYHRCLMCGNPPISKFF